MSDAALKPASDDTAPLTLEAYKKLFDTARDDMAEGRKDSELSRDFFDGDQWTTTEAATIRGRGQIPIVIPRIQRAVEGILGVVESNKTDVRALMRNPPDEQPQNPQAGAGPSTSATTVQPGPMPPSAVPMQASPQPKQKKPLTAADVATMSLRYAMDMTQFKDTTEMVVLETMIIEGCGAAIVEVDQKLDITIELIRWEEFFFDPKSRRPDFRDARYLGIAKWMYADDVAALYPKIKSEIDRFQSDGAQGLGLDETWEDRPEAKTPWIDSKLRRLMVVDMYHLYKGEWWRCVFYAGGVLESAVSAYKDDEDRPCCPIEGVSCYINRKNERYGVVKAMRDLQRGINMANSKALHEINVRQVQQVEPSSPPVDVDTVRREAARPDGVIPSGWQVVPRQDSIASNVDLRAYYTAEMERTGAAPAVLARQGADASGRAQQIRVQTGLTELAPVLNRHSAWKLRMCHQIWWRQKQYWTDPKWIRVTNDNQTPEYLRINVPPDPMTGQVPIDPKTGRPYFHIAQIDVDIVLDKVPDTATLEQEIFSDLLELVKVGVMPPQVLIRFMSVPKKQEILDELEAHQQAQSGAQQMQMQAEMAKIKADLAEIQSTIRKNDSQSDLNEANTVATAMKAHLEVNRAVQLPPGVTVNNSGTPVPIVPPPPPGATGANGQKTNGPPPYGR